MTNSESQGSTDCVTEDLIHLRLRWGWEDERTGPLLTAARLSKLGHCVTTTILDQIYSHESWPIPVIPSMREFIVKLVPFNTNAKILRNFKRICKY